MGWVKSALDDLRAGTAAETSRPPVDLAAALAAAGVGARSGSAVEVEDLRARLADVRAELSDLRLQVTEWRTRAVAAEAVAETRAEMLARQGAVLTDIVGTAGRPAPPHTAQRAWPAETLSRWW